MSWLLAATIPTVLMLAIFGLERIETGLNRAADGATEVTTLPERADANAG